MSVNLPFSLPPFSFKIITISTPRLFFLKNNIVEHTSRSVLILENPSLVEFLAWVRKLASPKSILKFYMLKVEIPWSWLCIYFVDSWIFLFFELYDLLNRNVMFVELKLRKIFISFVCGRRSLLWIKIYILLMFSIFCNLGYF